MRTFTIPVHIDEFDVEELPAAVQELREAAEAACRRAYAPYSGFQVGASLRMESGIIVTGNNQENAAYPSGMCAERVAIWYAGSQYPGQRILQMYITVHSNKRQIDHPVPPCGACRQSILEYEVTQDYPIEIWFRGETGKVWRTRSIQNILPLIFDGSDL